MNKKVSKTLAAVLSAAMAASAFAMSTSASFAADTDTATADTVNVAAAEANITTATQRYQLPTANDLSSGEYNHLFSIVYKGSVYTPTSVAFKADNGWVVANDSTSLVSVNGNGRVTAKANVLSGYQTATITRKVILAYTNGEVGSHNSKGTITAEATFTVKLNIYPNGGYAVLPEDNSGNAIESSTVTVSVNEPVDFNVYQIGTDNKNEEATFDKTLDNVWSEDVTFSSSNSNIPVDADEGVVMAQNSKNVHTGTATISATANSAEFKNKPVVPAQLTVENSYQVSGDEKAFVTSTYGEPTTTWLVSDLDKDLGFGQRRLHHGQDGTDSTAYGDYTRPTDESTYDVTGMKIVIGKDYDDKGHNSKETKLVLPDNSSVGDIVKGDATEATVVVEGQTGNISADNVYVNTTHDGTRWNNQYQDLRDEASNDEVKTGDITASNIVVEGSTVASTQEGAYLDTVTGDLNGSTISIKSSEGHTDSKYYALGAVETGDITVGDSLTLESGEHASAVSVGKIQGTLGDFDDCPYNASVTVKAGTFTLGDLTYIGDVVIGQNNASVANVTVGAIDTGTYEPDNEFSLCGGHSDSSITVYGKSTLTADTIKTDHVVAESQGTIVVPENSFEITSDERSKTTKATLIVKDAKVGSVLYTGAGAYNRQGALFFMPGIQTTVAENVGNNTYQYKAATLSLQGITLNTTAANVGQSPITLTASTLPTSVNALPEGYHLEWTATGNSVELTPSADTLSCTVKATGYTANNINGSNNVTVTATIVDEDGNMIGDTYVVVPSASAQLTLTNAAPENPLTGISLSATSMRVAPEQSKQLTVNFTPADADGDKTVTWTSSDESIATVDANGNVTGVKDGTATITATCGSFTATCDVTVSENPFYVTVTNAEGEKIECAADGSTVIEVPQSMAFNFDITSEDEIADFDYTVGNCKVGGTNTNSVWNGTSGSYQIYAAGAVGSETGAYINGIKIFTLKVTERPFTSDTTLNMNIQRGKTYQFAITPNDPNASFTFLTANGEALSTSYNAAYYPDSNGTYYCKVTANAINQDVGVYCVIDGKTYKVFTAHLVG